MGSLVKPFVYLTALETGRYNAATVVNDEPIDVELSRTARVWQPENFTKQIYGPVPLVRALAESLNLATVTIGLDVGVPKVTKTLQRFGLQRKPTEVPAHAARLASTSRRSRPRSSTTVWRMAAFARRCAPCAR